MDSKTYGDSAAVDADCGAATESLLCLLDELPLHLIPRRALEPQSWEESPREPLLFNPECFVTSAGQVPAALESQRPLLAGFNQQHAIAWVRDPATRSLLPFWLGPRLQPIISGLRAGQPAPAGLSADIRFLLAGSGILVPAHDAKRRRAQWSETVGRWGPVFREKGFAPLRELIHPFTVAALRRYYRQAIRRGSVQLGDSQCHRRYVAHSERIARFFHYQLAHAVSAITGEAVKPSYVYLASYLSGAEVKRHTDREQCEFSISLCLDFSPEPESETPWPLRLDTRAGTVAVYQALGDGLLYRGRILPHHRNVLAEGRTSTSIIFHYVQAGFSGSLE